MQFQTDLEFLPQPALEVRDGAVTAVNAAARELLPRLAPGQPLSGSLARLSAGAEAAGRFEAEDQIFFFTRVVAQDRQLIFLRTARSSPLTAGQLDGFSRQMREQLGGLLNQMELLARQLDGDGLSAPQISGLSHSFHRMLRLMNNLEFLNLSEEELKRQFLPVTMDLAGLCRDLKRQAAPMLRKAGVELRYDSDRTGLLIPGNPALMQRLLLGLISNAAKAAPGRPVVLSLRLRGNRAAVTVSGGEGEDTGLDALLRHSDPLSIPAPGDGAGMGLAVARRITALHDGALLARRREDGGLAFTLSLSTGPLDAQLSLHSPAERDGGLSPFLVELADVLPVQLFQPDLD